MMRQVFYNLATNAFKAMPDGGTLTISVEPRNGAAVVRFEDTGIGMDDDEMKNALSFRFIPLSRTEPDSDLPIVYQIVTAHNGVIGVKSQQGRRISTFFVDLKK